MEISKIFITAEVYGAHMVVQFRSRDVAQLENVKTALKEIHGVVEESNARLLIINFTRVDFLSSLFLGKLIELYKRLGARGTQLSLCCMTPETEKIYKFMNLHKLAPVYPTEEAALKAWLATKAPEPRAASSGRTWRDQALLPPWTASPGQEERP